MNSATAGSTVSIKGGTYHERLTLNVSGTAGAYITFQPAGYDGTGCGASIAANGYVTCPGDQVILDYAYLGTVTNDSTPFLNINNKSYVKIQGLTFLRRFNPKTCSTAEEMRWCHALGTDRLAEPG
jgi:hypothetical protein